MSTEKRKRKRFTVGSETFAAFIRPDEPIVVGRIMDISRGGLAVHYLGSGKVGEVSTKIRIFGPNLHPTNRIECKIVYDEAFTEESTNVLSVRRCGLKFSQIAQFQSAKLQSLIQTSIGII
jgi:c-di-GMP-binding flagellar brake protein YcgR